MIGVQERVSEFQAEVDHLKSMFEVIRHCSNQLTTDAEDTEERVSGINECM